MRALIHMHTRSRNKRKKYVAYNIFILATSLIGGHIVLSKEKETLLQGSLRAEHKALKTRLNISSSLLENKRLDVNKNAMFQVHCLPFSVTNAH